MQVLVPASNENDAYDEERQYEDEVMRVREMRRLV